MEISESVYLSTRGAERRVNEDGILSLKKDGFFAVADGTGGVEAARLALGQLKDEAENLAHLAAAAAEESTARTRGAVANLFIEAFARAHHQVARAGAGCPQELASSLVCVTVAGSQAYIAHVGDTRAYLIRGSELECLTNDHTLAMLQLRRGQIDPSEFATSPYRQTLTRALGVGTDVRPDVAEVRLMVDDVVLLCSNGLTRLLQDAFIRRCVVGKDLHAAAKQLISAAKLAGAPDDVTVLLVRAGRSTPPQTGAPRMTPRERARASAIFRGFNTADWGILSSYLEPDCFETGGVIVSQGQPAERLYVVTKGRVVCHDGARERREIGPGSAFGEVALAARTTSYEQVVALQPVEVLSLSRAAYAEIGVLHPEIKARLAVTLLSRLGEVLGQLGRGHDPQEND